MAEKTKPEGEETEAKGGKKKLLVIVAVLLVAVGAGAYFFLFSGSGDAKAAPPEKGAVVALDPIAVNLAGGGYLKIGIALQLSADAGEEAPDGSEALDLVISTYSQANPTDVITARDALKEAVEKKIVDAYKEDGTEIVMGIYLTQYVTQ
jgi:flagellar FliL protein